MDDIQMEAQRSYQNEIYNEVMNQKHEQIEYYD